MAAQSQPPNFVVIFAIPDNVFFYYQHTQLQAVRSGRWKLVLPRFAATSVAPPRWANMIPPEDRIDVKRPMLFNLQADIGEKKDVARSHPEVVAELMRKIGWAREDIGDWDRIGKNARVFDPQPKRPDIGQNTGRPIPHAAELVRFDCLTVSRRRTSLRCSRTPAADG